MINDKMNEDNRNKELAEYFKRKAIKVHVSRKDGIFYNGEIKLVGSDFLIIDDDKTKSQLVFFSEIKGPIREFREEVSSDR